MNYLNGKVLAPLHVWQRGAIALCEWAVGYDHGRSKDDPVYKLVTENRDGPGPKDRANYSSCGDLAHFLLERLGVRAPWLNRNDDNSFGAWKAGVNVSNLWGAACPIDTVPGSDWTPEPGDILLLWNTGYDAHVCVSSGKYESGRLTTYNYGAGGMSTAISPGARIGVNKLAWNGKNWVYGSKVVQRCLKLRDVLSLLSAKPLLTEGCSLSGEDIDAMELGVKPDDS
jgi:hypothetical protein